VLEIGAGHGRDTMFFASNGLEVEALDYSSRGIEIINKKAIEKKLPVKSQLFDVKKPLLFQDTHFDATYSHMLLNMRFSRAELHSIFSEIRRVLKPNGLNYFSVRNHNDQFYGAIVSPLFKGEFDKQIEDILGINVHTMPIADFNQTGSMLVSNNYGAGIHPKASEKEIEIVSSILKVDVEPLTINGGIPYLSSGIICNSKSLVVGSITTGPELIMLSRGFKM